jgi:hypothetical protein
MKFHRIAPTERARWQPGIAALEATAKYPLGDDFFQIDHGADYFAFFDRLGEVDYYIGVEQQQVVAVGAGILRQVSDRAGAELRPAWYLCDLKVHPMHQGKLASVRMLSYAIAQGIERCDRGYLISMNPSDGRPNRLVQMLQKFPLVPLQLMGTLLIYSVDADRMVELEPLLRSHRGEIGYRSLSGIKDLRLQRSGAVLPLVHVQWGLGKGNMAVQAGMAYMFCAMAGDPLVQDLAAVGVAHQATASVVAHGMGDCDWRFMLTSDL